MKTKMRIIRVTLHSPIDLDKIMHQPFQMMIWSYVESHMSRWGLFCASLIAFALFRSLAVEQNIQSWIQSVGNLCSSHSHILEQGGVMHMNDVPLSSLSARNGSKMQIRSGSTVILSSHSCILADPASAVCLTHYAIQWDLHELIKWPSFRKLIITLFATDTLKY